MIWEKLDKLFWQLTFCNTIIQCLFVSSKYLYVIVADAS